MRISPSPPAVATLLLSALVLAGCGTPPGLAESPAPPRSGPPTATPTGPTGPTGGTTPVFPTAGPLPSGGFATDVAVACAGDPDAAAVIAVLRDEGVVPGSADVSVADGPLCAGDWQYTVFTMPGVDPLQVVTRRDAGGLQLVTAGSDVCIVDVEVQAPPGIRAVAGCPV